MARTTERLTAVEVTNFKTPGLYPDGAGLYLKITPTGTKSWIFRFKVGKVAHDMGLGPVGTVGLARARKLAGEARRQRLEGRDPIKARKAQRAAEQQAQARAITFKECAEAYVKAHEAEWSNPKHRGQWRSTLGLPPEGGERRRPGQYRKPSCPSVIATIGYVPVAEIETSHVMSCLQPLWDAGLHETCGRVRGRIERILDWARVSGYRQGENPSRWKGHISELVGSRDDVAPVRHHPAVDYAEIPDLMADLARLDSISARALAFTILCASRTNEVIGMQWPEIDLEAKLWTVPAGRMKGKKAKRREHRVPLSDAALTILKEMGGVKMSPYVFPGLKRGKPLSNMAMLECLRGLRPGYTVHGVNRRGTLTPDRRPILTPPLCASSAAQGRSCGA